MPHQQEKAAILRWPLSEFDRNLNTVNKNTNMAVIYRKSSGYPAQMIRAFSDDTRRHQAWISE